MSDNRILLGLPDYRKLSSILSAMKSKRRPLEAHIRKFEDELKSAEIVDVVDEDSVSIGSNVSILNLEDGSQVDLRIVFPAELDGSFSTASVFSPLGTALMGERPGAMVRCDTPGGVLRFKVLSVSRTSEN